jgi:hypothetical protein
MLQRSQELSQTLRHTAHNITAVPIFWQQEWELQLSLLFKPHFPSI